jgi:hypothetical protein
VSAPLFLDAGWTPPRGVRAAFTTRAGGVSAAPYATLNVGAHVGDAPAAVTENRRRVRDALRLPSEPLWLEQVHGVDVVEVADASAAVAMRIEPPRADAVVVRTPGVVAAIQVADCLPVLLATADGRAIAAAHAGWRGLAGGVIERTVAALGGAPAALSAWLGPAIGPAHFEVGAEVRAAFCEGDPQACRHLVPNARGRWLCDLAALARLRLERLGVPAPAGGTWCTYADAARFFSHRRAAPTGRMVALLWLDGGD